MNNLNKNSSGGKALQSYHCDHMCSVFCCHWYLTCIPVRSQKNMLFMCLWQFLRRHYSVNDEKYFLTFKIIQKKIRTSFVSAKSV